MNTGTHPWRPDQFRTGKPGSCGICGLDREAPVHGTRPDLIAGMLARAVRVQLDFLDRLEEATGEDDPLLKLRVKIHAPLRAAMETALAAYNVRYPHDQVLTTRMTRTAGVSAVNENRVMTDYNGFDRPAPATAATGHSKSGVSRRTAVITITDEAGEGIGLTADLYPPVTGDHPADLVSYCAVLAVDAIAGVRLYRSEDPG